MEPEPRRSAAMYLRGFAAILGFGVLRLLPPATALWLMGALLERLGPRLKRSKRIRVTLALAFPELGHEAIEARTRAIWRNFGRTVATIPHLGNFVAGTRGARVSYQGAEHFGGLAGKPAVVCGAHVGNWEVSAVVPSEMRRTIVVSYNAGEDPVTEALIARCRKATGCELVEKQHIPRKSAESLKAGKLMYFTIDQRVDAGSEISFLGLPALASRLPARLAVKYGVPILLVEAVWKEAAHYEVIFHPPLYPDLAIADDDERTRDLMVRMFEGIEGMVKRRPDEWFCLKKRWSRDETAAIRADRAAAEARARSLQRRGA